MGLRLRVDLLPKGGYEDTVILVDVLRATTTAAVLLERGARQLLITPSLEAARVLAERDRALLVGERGGLPPVGFHFGNTPSTLIRQDFTETKVVITTTNGAAALPVVADAKALLLGSFFNARAAVEFALSNATSELAIVCAGREGVEGLDDTLCAGFLAALAQRSRPDSELQDAAHIAIAVHRSFPDPQEGLWRSQAGQSLVRLGLQEDLAWASLISQTERVPRRTAQEVVLGAGVYHFEP